MSAKCNLRRYFLKAGLLRKMLCFQMIILFSFSMIFSQIPAEEGSVTYYVPADYPTIQDAIDVAGNGDTIIVHAGVYHESVSIDKQLTLVGDGTVEVDANGSYYGFELRADGIIIDHFQVTGTGSGGNKAAIRVISNNNIIRNCEVKNNANYGILVYKNVSGNTIEKTSLIKNYYGVYIQSATNTLVKECTVHNNDIYGIQLQYAENNVIQANTIFGEIVGLYLWDSSGNTLSENRISTCKLHGIDLRKSNNNIIFNNYFNNSKNGYDLGENSWNIEIIQDTNILGGPYICGNFWSQYPYTDADANGIGDVAYSIPGGTNQDLYPICIQPNYAPYIPNTPFPPDASSKMKRTLSLSWQCSDPDGDDCFYEIYLGPSNPPIQKIGKSTDCLYSIEGLEYDQTYYWQVFAYDNTTWNHSMQSPIWSFTTESKPQKSSSNGGSNDGGTFRNEPPVADIFTNGQYQAYINEQFFFDGSQSYDSDGIIETYLWDFGDETTGEGQTITHEYPTVGEYTVTLTVKDNYGFTDTDTATVLIKKANRPPQQPDIRGPVNGTIGINYLYHVKSIDEDNDTIKYIITWGDNQTTESTFLPNATTYSSMHSWSTAGRYIITAKTSDNETESSSNSISVLINAIYVHEKGYLLDENNDGIYDAYYSNQTENTTIVGKDQNDTYRIDDDGDGEWDYEFSVTTQQLSAYTSPVSVQGTDTTMIMFSLGLVVVLILMLLIGIAYKNKKNK